MELSVFSGSAQPPTLPLEVVSIAPLLAKPVRQLHEDHLLADLAALLKGEST